MQDIADREELARPHFNRILARHALRPKVSALRLYIIEYLFP